MIIQFFPPFIWSGCGFKVILSGPVYLKVNVRCWVRAVGRWVRPLAVWHSCARCSPFPASLSSCWASASCPLSPESLHRIHAPSSRTSAATRDALWGEVTVILSWLKICFNWQPLLSKFWFIVLQTFSHFFRLLFPLFDLIFIDQPAERMTHINNHSDYMNKTSHCFSYVKKEAIFEPTLLITCVLTGTQTPLSILQSGGWVICSM